MRTTLTKERLMELGVTDVKEDGRVFVKGKEKKAYRITTKHPYGQDKTYLAVALQDYSRKVDIVQKVKRKDGSIYKHNSWAYAVKVIPLARLMLAWFNNEVPGDMDADHIDGNPLNNHISNLQIISRRENLAKRLLSYTEIARLYRSVERQLKGK